ncbi:MAG TPA: GAF domain-containing protein [Thermoflexia bacterium]|nr:GAF domain-containing protein [Thermoflexia bacterium]
MENVSISNPQHSQAGISLRGWIVVAALTVAAFFLILAAFLAWRTTQVPFLGLFTEPTLVVNGSGDQAWPGYAAGIQAHDHLIALDDQPLKDTIALMAVLSGYEPGDVVTLTAIGVDGARRKVQVSLEPIPLQALTIFFVLPYILGLIYLGLGVWVFVVRRRESAGRAFGMMCAVLALSLGLLFDAYTTHWLQRVWIVAISLTGSAIAHLALVFPQRARLLDRFPALRYLVYAPGVIIAIINQFTVLNFDAPRAYFDTWLAAFVFAAVGALVFIAMVIYCSRSSQSPIVQAQARAILWGGLAAFGPLAVWFLTFKFTRLALSPEITLPWLILFPVSIAYAILRYRLFDVNVVVSRGVVYALLSAGVVGMYFLALYLVSLVFGVTLQANHPFALGVFVLLLALLLTPARMRLQRVVDRVFLRETIDQRQIVRRFGDRLTETTGLQSVLHVLDETLEAGWHLRSPTLFLYDPQRECYAPHPIGSDPLPSVTFDQGGPLARQMLQQRESVYLYQDHPLPAHLMPESEALETLRSSLCVPVPGHGWLALGPKRGGAPFSSEDLTTLESLGSQTAVALEKARLFSDLERRMMEVNALRRVGQAVNFSMDVDDLMELVYAQTSRVLDTSTFYIALHSREKGTLSFAFYVEDGERLYKDDEWSADTGLTGEIVRTGRPIVTEDYVQECRRRGVEPGGKPGRAWMGAPLSAGDQIIGAMSVSSFDPSIKYSDEQAQFFSAIADQSAAILDKAHLYQEMEERARQLAALNEVGSVITSTLDLQTVLDLIMSKAVELLQAEAGSLVLVDQDTDELVFKVTTGPGSADLAGTRLPSGTGVLGMVVQEGKPVIIRDAQADQRWYQDLDAEFITRSIIAVPMISRGRAIGVIELLNRRDGVPFDEDDERLLTAFATNAAVSIENAWLFTRTDQALEARVEELSMMQRIDRELNATLDYDRVMSLTLDWALRTTWADVGLVAAVVETEDGMRGLRFLANQGYPEEFFAEHKEKLWPLEQGITGRVARTGKPELVEDVGSDPDYVSVGPDMAAQLSAPIQREDQIIGVITLESSQQGLFDQEALGFAVRLADHAAIAIENARLFEQVRRANDAKTEFVSFVSHELKQPMTSMKGYIDLLDKGMAGELNDAQHNFLATVRSNVNRMNTLVSGLLDISRIESGRIKINLVDVSIEQIVEESLRTIRGQIEAKQQTLAVNVSADLPLVRGDRDRLVQVLTNLASNAHKYTPTGGQITVLAQEWPEAGEGQGEFVLCSVTDTGIGMSLEDQGKLFTKYFRSEDPAVRSESGTGLGLAITRSLVELQGGEIWVESKVGEGSTFAFTIPVAR